LLTIYGDFSKICYNQKNVIWWDLSSIQKTENLFLTKIGGAFTLKNADLRHPSAALLWRERGWASRASQIEPTQPGIPCNNHQGVITVTFLERKKVVYIVNVLSGCWKSKCCSKIEILFKLFESKILDWWCQIEILVENRDNCLKLIFKKYLDFWLESGFSANVPKI